MTNKERIEEVKALLSKKESFDYNFNLFNSNRIESIGYIVSVIEDIIKETNEYKMDCNCENAVIDNKSCFKVGLKFTYLWYVCLGISTYNGAFLL